MTLYTLADRLGKTVGELERTLTLDELAGWEAYFRIRQEKKTT